MFAKNKKLRLVIVLFCLLLLSVNFAYAKIDLKFTHVLPPQHPYQAACEKMKEIVEAKTNGEVTITIYPSASLAEEPVAIESLEMGTIDLTTVSAAPVTGFVKEFMACDLPFLFKTSEEAYKFYDGEIGDELFKLTEKIGLVGLAWWDNGFRNFTNNIRPLIKPDDFKGLKIRTMNSPVHMASVKALGANPVPIDFGELYTALQQGVVDGQENPVANIYTSRFQEVQKYLTMSRHVYDPSPVFISAKTWGKLTPEQQQIVKEAAIVARDYMRKITNDEEAGIIEKLKKEGMEVTFLTTEEAEAFQTATKDVWKDFVNEIGEDFLTKYMTAAREAGKN